MCLITALATRKCFKYRKTIFDLILSAFHRFSQAMHWEDDLPEEDINYLAQLAVEENVTGFQYSFSFMFTCFTVSG